MRLSRARSPVGYRDEKLRICALFRYGVAGMTNGIARAVVTGAAGFLGHHLVATLRSAAVEVLPIVHEVTSQDAAGSVAMSTALSEPGILDGFDVLIHAAAVRHRHGVGATAYRASNVDLVLALLRASAGRVRRFVLVSSVGVYGFPEDLPIREEHPFAPRTLYGVTKVEAERLVRTLAPELGLEFCIVRPTIIYGTGDRNGMLDKMERMIRGRRYRLVGTGQNTLHHVHIDDVLAGLRLAATSPAAAGQDFILAGPETITLAKLGALVAREVGTPLPSLAVPLSVARAVGAVFDVMAYRGLVFGAREPPINGEKLDVMTRSIAFDTSKAERVLGYRPRVSYETGIARTLGPG